MAGQLLLLIRQDRLRHRDKRPWREQTGRWAVGEIKANNIAQFERARVIRSSSDSFFWTGCRQRGREREGLGGQIQREREIERGGGGGGEERGSLWK